jgi:hypothetical protein
VAHFEREVPSYAEPVSKADLKDGGVYFSAQFMDEAMLIPIVETLVFAGTDLEEGDQGALYFQDAGSYRHGIRYDSEGADCANFYIQDEHSIKHIFEYDRALDGLIQCALRRKTAQP